MKTVHLLLLFSTLTNLYLCASDDDADRHNYHLAIQDEATSNQVFLETGTLPIVFETEKIALAYIAACLETATAAAKYIEALQCLYQAGALPFGELLHFLGHPAYQGGYSTHHFILVDDTKHMQAPLETAMLSMVEKDERDAVWLVVKERLRTTKGDAKKQFIVGVHDLFLSNRITAEECLGLLGCNERIYCLRSGSTNNTDLVSHAHTILA